jgi:hypothetical protein
MISKWLASTSASSAEGAVRRNASRNLAPTTNPNGGSRLVDTRAIEPVRELAQRKGLLGLVETCEAPTARAALKKLEKR